MSAIAVGSNVTLNNETVLYLYDPGKNNGDELLDSKDVPAGTKCKVTTKVGDSIKVECTIDNKKYESTYINTSDVTSVASGGARRNNRRSTRQQNRRSRNNRRSTRRNRNNRRSNRRNRN